MKNLFASGEGSKVFERFDLKGSRYGRHASAEERAKPFPTLKDLDFIDEHPMGLELDGDTHDWLMNLVRVDCLALQEWGVMDYSLLVGISRGRLEGGYGGLQLALLSVIEWNPILAVEAYRRRCVAVRRRWSSTSA